MQGKVKARAAGITLAAGATSELVIDAAGLVAFSAHDMQTTQGHHLVVLGVCLLFVLQECGIPLGALGSTDGADLQHVGVFALLAEVLLGHVLGISAQQNVGTATGHVGGDGDGGFPAGLGDDESLAFVLLGVQDFVLDAYLL